MKFAVKEFVEQLFHIERQPTQWVWLRSGNGEPDFEARTPFDKPWIERAALQCKPGGVYMVGMQLVDQEGNPMGAPAMSEITIPAIKVNVPTVIHLTL